MLESAIRSLNNFFNQYGWAGEIAGILPFSAVIDFIETAPKLHTLQLTGHVLPWTWVVTPSASRLLLEDSDSFSNEECHQDRYGVTTALQAIDGRYGDQYTVSSAETFRLLQSSYPTVEVENDHHNMSDKSIERRPQVLEVVHVSRLSLDANSKQRRAKWIAWCTIGNLYLACGWALFIATILISAFFKAWISFAYLLIVPGTGYAVALLYGRQPRRLHRVGHSSKYGHARLILVAEHINSSKWLAVYGESTLVNSLLNRPLVPDGKPPSRPQTAVFRFVLRFLILGQWALALAASATKNLNAYLMSFWIIFCIFSHSFLVTPKRTTKSWGKHQIDMKIERHSTTLSTRRALLNTVMALNPDTIQANKPDKEPTQIEFSKEALKLLDPILTTSESRSEWEEATRKAMEEIQSPSSTGEIVNPDLRKSSDVCLSSKWNKEYSKWWAKFIPEGMYMAAKLRKEARLPRKQIPLTASDADC